MKWPPPDTWPRAWVGGEEMLIEAAREVANEIGDYTSPRDLLLAPPDSLACRMVERRVELLSYRFLEKVDAERAAEATAEERSPCPECGKGDMFSRMKREAGWPSSKWHCFKHGQRIMAREIMKRRREMLNGLGIDWRRHVARRKRVAAERAAKRAEARAAVDEVERLLEI